MRRLVVTASGTAMALTLLIGAGVLSLVQDSATSQDNTVASGTYVHDVRVAPVSPSASCPTDLRQYSDGPIAAVVRAPGAATVTPGSNLALSSTVSVCVRNFGSHTGRLLVGFPINQVIQTESACSPGEAAEDTSCGSGHGELAGLMRITWHELGSSPCETTGFRSFGQYIIGPVVLSAGLPPTGVCKLGAFFGMDPEASETANVRAQTDRVQWDIIFTLQDPPDEPSTGEGTDSQMVGS